jgi:hypothetical protein
LWHLGHLGKAWVLAPQGREQGEWVQPPLAGKQVQGRLLQGPHCHKGWQTSLASLQVPTQVAMVALPVVLLLVRAGRVQPVQPKALQLRQWQQEQEAALMGRRGRVQLQLALKVQHRALEVMVRQQGPRQVLVGKQQQLGGQGMVQACPVGQVVVALDPGEGEEGVTGGMA